MTNDFATRASQALPPDAAFVVHVGPGIDVAGGQVFGRVEHVLSGTSSRFGSIEELLVFIDRVLARSTQAKLNPEQGGSK